ncbi:MAG: hypothetical protein QW795_04165 [Candidatus Bathyarchaeia archaeon]
MDQYIFEGFKMYANKNRQVFAKTIRHSLNEILGGAAAETLIYYIGGNKALEDPDLIMRRLMDALGAGANAIFKYMLREMERSAQKHEP